MRIHTVVFDFGNVVGFFDHRRATSRLAEHAAMPLDAMHAYLFGGQLEDDYESNRISSDDFLRQVLQACGLRCSKEALAAAYADIFWPNRDVCELIPQLKPRYRLLLGSNTTELHSRHFRRQFADTLRHFDALVLSHDIGVRKPKAAFFEHCVRLAGCSPAECLFIDDMPANVAGARECGWQGIVYQNADELRKSLVGYGVLESPRVPTRGLERTEASDPNHSR